MKLKLKHRINLSIFHRKKIVHSKHMKPATMLYYHKVNQGGKLLKLVRVAFQNQVKVPGTLPITDILLQDITKVIVLPSEFDKWLYSLVFLKPKKKTYIFKNGKAYAVKNPVPKRTS